MFSRNFLKPPGVETKIADPGPPPILPAVPWRANSMRITTWLIVIGFVGWCSCGIAAEPRPVSLKWIEAESRHTLFTVDDIVRFDWEKQLFELQRDAAIDLMMLPPALEHEFIVVAAGSEICRGQLVSSSSSKTYQGPTIVVDSISGASAAALPSVWWLPPRTRQSTVRDEIAIRSRGGSAGRYRS